MSHSTAGAGKYIVVQQDDALEDEELLLPWVCRFLKKPGNEFFCAVDTEFILDRFNLTDLGRAVPSAQAGYDYLTNPEPGSTTNTTHI